MGALEDQNKELARRFLEALSRADVETIDGMYADDFSLRVPGTLPFSGTKGKQDALSGIPQVLGLFPDGLRFDIEALTAEGERVAIEATSDGVTFRGDRYQQTYHFLMRVRDGKIIEWREYMDTDLARKILVGEG